MTKLEQDFFFSVLRSAIWQKPLDCEIPQNFDWTPLVQSYVDQGLLAVVGKALLMLPKDVGPNEELREDILVYCTDMVQAHMIVNDAIVRSFIALEEVGCHPVLLKGQGLSLLYPEPYTRYVGDIDIYVDESEYVRACKAINVFCGIEHDERIMQRCPIHYEVSNGIVSFEVHRTFFSEKIYRRLSFINKFLASSVKNKSIDFVKINGKNIPILQVKDNCLYVFVHLMKHVFSEGIGVRQIIDWMLVLNKIQHQEKVSLKETLDKVGLYKVWNIWLFFICEKFGFNDSPNRYVDETKMNIITSFVLNGETFNSHDKKKQYQSLSAGICRWLQSVKSRNEELKIIKIMSPNLFYYKWYRYFKKSIVNVLNNTYKRN